ncbi:MAG: ABC transporter ATP-binding protein [Gemmatimonadetes bacterium]|nr:ABC transporter ATP-binding protein [Gemmatimonadota bacterium]
MTPAVALRGLTRRFGDVTAVSDVTLAVERGELFGIVGPDGAGKTTTLRKLAGVLGPREGDAQVLGVSVARDPERVKPHVAYMSQRFGLYEDLTVGENIEFYADLYRVPRAERPARLERLYRFSSLGPFQSRLAGNLSGGMKQKLSLSCALIHHPEVLLLDEPTFGVDPISRRDLWLILHEMVAEGVTVVVTTSYLDEAERCDRVALLDHGRVLALDSPARLQERLPGRLLAVRTNDPRRARELLKKLEGVRRAELFGDTVHLRFEQAAADETRVRSALTAAGIEVLAIEPLEPSLEDVFMELVAGAGNGANEELPDAETSREG